MKSFNYNYFKSSLKEWTYPRALQLIIGVVIMMSGITEPDYGIAAIGGLFIGLALLNVGCGALSGKSCKVDDCK